ncbi:leucine-rich repeat extensin-like protein 5 [Helianthus annuus]|uniref:leucine-rich repeat extensin-like protein 5 n=1 Tax=Helianthus annuus TaxID=4232 RepID=UPI000B902643|nr:leucine-rich repeat extensin-like protein 5 [Helianthus annuus]
MPPHVRGKGKGPMRGGPSSHAGPSHRRTPSASFSSDSHDDWRHSLEPARRSVSLSTLPSYHHSFGLLQPDEPQHSHHSQHSLHSHSFHHSSHHSDSHRSYSQGHFNPDDYINAPTGYNPLGPEGHFLQDMDMDDDPDPQMPPSGTPTHPIDISSGSSFAGSPYRGPDTYKEWFGQWDFVNTPSFHNAPPQPPLEDPHFQAVTPPPLPAEEPPLPPPEPPRWRRNAHMSVRGGPRISSPQASSNYPPIPENPQMGEPLHTVPEIDTTPATFAPPPPPMGYENPIPTYPGPTGYNPFKP